MLQMISALWAIKLASLAVSLAISGSPANRFEQIGYVLAQ